MSIRHEQIPALRLSQYLELLEQERHKYTPLNQLYDQLEHGLKIHDSEGREAIYYNFELNPISKNIPVLVGEGFSTLYAEGVVKQEELERFFVWCEDVAGYFRANHPYKTDFYWLDSNGQRVTLIIDEHAREDFISFPHAEAILQKRFNKPGHGVTRGEISVWLDNKIIHARNFAYAGAWSVDYPKWVDKKHKESAPEALSLEDCLFPLYFSQEELERVQPRERWLSYSQLLERWKSFSLSENAVLSIIENCLCLSGLQIINSLPISLSQEELGTICSGDCSPPVRVVRAYIPSATYKLSVIEEYERKHLLPAQIDITGMQRITGDGAERSDTRDPDGSSESNSKNTIAAENLCKKWLIDLMSGDSKPEKAKPEYQEEAQQKFSGLSTRSFMRAWGNAVAETENINWVKPGRKS